MRSHPHLGVLLAWAGACLAGEWTVGGRAGAVLENGKFVPSAAVTADYSLSNILTWRTDFDVRVKDANDLSRSEFQVPSNLLVHPLTTRRSFDPYLGPGVSASSTAEGTLGAGANLVAGFLVHPARSAAFGAEWRWGWPDLVRNAKTQHSVSLVGNWETRF